MPSNDEVERCAVATMQREYTFSHTSTPFLAHRRRDPRSLEPVVKLMKCIHWAGRSAQPTPDILLTYPGAAAAVRQAHPHSWDIDPLVRFLHMQHKMYTRTSICVHPPSPATDRSRSIRNWVSVEAWRLILWDHPHNPGDAIKCIDYPGARAETHWLWQLISCKVTNLGDLVVWLPLFAAKHAGSQKEHQIIL